LLAVFHGSLELLATAWDHSGEPVAGLLDSLLSWDGTSQACTSLDTTSGLLGVTKASLDGLGVALK